MRSLSIAIAALAAGITATSAYASSYVEGTTGVGQPLATPIGTGAPAAGQHASRSVAENGFGRLAASDRLSVVADTIFSLGSDTGFAGQELDPKENRINLYWKGNLPADVERYLATAKRVGVDVRVSTAARYTRSELQDASGRVADSAALVERAGIVTVTAEADGSGISVQFAEEVPDTQTWLDIVQVSGLPSRALTAQPKVGALQNAASRVADLPPWKGGIRTVHGNYVCSSGFTATAGSQERILSADHCGKKTAVKNGAGLTIAPASAIKGKPNIDSMSIDPSASPGTDAKLYVGGWNSTTTSTVKNWAANWKGETVCSSGASTGSNCGKVLEDSIAYPGFEGRWYVKVRASSGTIFGGGDSGGAMFRRISGGVQARGIILAGYTATQRPCGSTNPDVNPPCYQDGLYIPISVVLNSWGYRLDVG